MAQAIEIDDEVFERLKDEAEPFVDTPNSVLRRLLGLGQGTADPSVEPVSKEMSPVRSNGRATKKSAGRSTKTRGGKGGKRVPAGSILSEEAYELPLLAALADAGGSGTSRDITEAVGATLDGRLTGLDRESLKSGGIRWENRIQFVRLKLIERGFLEKDTPRGTWAISDAGRRFLEDNR